MKLYWSPMDIPEFDNLPVKAARPVWRRCWRNHHEGWGPVVLMMVLGPLIGEWITGGNSQSLGHLIGLALGAAIGYHLSIALLRPKIRQHLGIDRP